MSEHEIPEQLVGWCSSCEKLCYDSEFDPETADGQEWAECPSCGDGLITRDDDEHSQLLNHIIELEAKACRFYRADGTYETLASPAAVIERRIECAKLIAKLEAERDRLEGLTAELSADAGIQAFVDSFEGIKAENAQLRAERDKANLLLKKTADTISLLPSVTGLSPVTRFEDIPLAIRDLQECYISAARSRNGADLAAENAQLRAERDRAVIATGALEAELTFAGNLLAANNRALARMQQPVTPEEWVFHGGVNFSEAHKKSLSNIITTRAAGKEE